MVSTSGRHVQLGALSHGHNVKPSCG
uniref:Uncharacterized protein n=1 Tax=Timema shepardi TaxID=629360 RepID=A0A7R9B8I8_TIMSH|nr:unnamed protein product [Timema shepardi]